MNVVGNVYNKSQWPQVNNNRHHNGEFTKAQSIKPDNFYESFRNPSDVVHHRKHKGKKQTKVDSIKHHHVHLQPSHYDVGKRQSVYDFIDQADITPLQTSNVYHSVSGLSPVGHLSDESTYAKLMEKPDIGPLHSTPCVTSSQSRARHERMSHGVDGHEARDRIYGPPDDQLKRKSHRSRRRGHKAYSYYGHGDDISYEYKGRLPNKNSSRAQSRDSGVNCVGLGGTNNHGKRRDSHLYENTPVSKDKDRRSYHPIRNSDQPHSAVSHVRFDADIGDSDVNEVTDPAFSSVVYGINSLVEQHGLSELGGPHNRQNDSEMANMMAGFNSESSQLPPPYPSLQSAFYDESSLNPTQPCAQLVTCEAEINPKAPPQTQELACETELIDVESLPDVREIAGSSDGMIRTITDKVSAISVSESVENCEKQEQHAQEDREREHENVADGGDPGMTDNHGEGGDANRNLKLCEKNGSGQLSKTEVADSGFSSPRNLVDDQHGQTSSQSQYSEHSGGQSQTENSDAHQHSEENAVSDSHHTHSDVNMASSEHNSGSTNDNADHSAEDSFGKRFPAHHISKRSSSSQSLKNKGSSQSVKSDESNSSRQSRKQQLYRVAHYSSAAKIMTHPDVFNNNTTAFNGQDHYAPPVTAHSNMINSQRMDPRRPKREKHRVDIVNIPPAVSDRLHRFEEEQLTKKFGAHGEYEVMGVL